MEYKSALQMRKENNAVNKALEKCKEEQMREIQKANERGYNRCLFHEDVRYEGKYYNVSLDMKEWLESLGYRIVATGYIGGVWQLTKDVIW